MTNPMQPGEHDLLLVIDVQNDFCDGGNLAVPGGSEVVPVVDRLAARFANCVLTQDWHPAGHSSFASSHAGRQAFEVVEFPYGPQVLWPDHCVQETPGAAFHPALSVPNAQAVIRKGFRPSIDSYSAFFENDHRTPTGLSGFLKERAIRRVFVAGLALDFCVRYSAEDAHAQGFETVVIADACRAIDQDGSRDAALDRFKDLDIALVDSAQIDG